MPETNVAPTRDPEHNGGFAMVPHSFWAVVHQNLDIRPIEITAYLFMRRAMNAGCLCWYSG